MKHDPGERGMRKRGVWGGGLLLAAWARVRGLNKSRRSSTVPLFLKMLLERIQDLVRGVSDKRLPTLSNCYCYLTGPFSQEKVW